MKVGPKLVFLFNDPEGFGAAIYDAVQPRPNSFFQRSKESFELSLGRYGIEDHKACGDIVHFTDGNGQLSVSMLLMQYCEPPILACAVNEVLGLITEENLLTTMTLTLPFVVPSSKLKSEEKNASMDNKITIYGAQVGPEAEFTHALISKVQGMPPSLQIHYEPLACLLHFVRVLKFPTALLIGQRGQHLSSKAPREELEVVCEMGQILASSFSLCFAEERVKLNLGKSSKLAEEQPWRALYG
ncbi:hypothetical protein Nepgr_014396 [Nepenthes gracilis]|uniref:DUF7894 domain-containing protein n=1 Tax=Nepenthes gracilis TaxID=150966 RepID=A0AAD3XQF3_NEPGR|nr:hypothetical protein Nepgr_014396 [Nepenthes gracilis]